MKSGINIIRNLTGTFSGKSLLLMIAGIGKMLSQLIVLYLYSRLLIPEAYGIYQSIWLYISIISVISLFGLPQLILSAGWNAVSAYVNNNKNKTILTGALLFCIPYVIFWLLTPDLSVLAKILLALCVIAQSIASIRECIALSHHAHQRVFKVNMLHNVLFLLIHGIILFHWYTPELLLLLLSITFIIKSAILQKSIYNKTEKQTPRNEILQKQWLLLGLFDMINIFQRWFDKWAILLFLSLTQFAIYFNGAYEIPIFGIMVSAVGSIMLVEWNKNNTKDRDIYIFHHSALLLSCFVYPAFAFLLMYHDLFFIWLFSSQYESAIPIFGIAIFIIPVRITNYTVVLQTLNRSDKIVAGAIFDMVVAVALMFILYPLMQMKGIILSMVIATWAQAIYYLIETGRIAGIPFSKILPYGKLILILALSLMPAFAVKFLMSGQSGNIQLIAGFTVAGLSAFFLFFFIHKKFIPLR